HTVPVLNEVDRQKLSYVFQKMKRHLAPSFRIYGTAGDMILAKLSSRKGNNPISIASNELSGFLEGCKKEVKALTPQPENKYERALCYGAILQTLTRLPIDDKARNIAEHDMADFMLDQNEIHYWLINDVFRLMQNEKEYAKTESLIEKASLVLSNDSCLLLCPYYDKKRIQDTLSEIKASLPGKPTNTLPWTSAKLCYTGTLFNLFVVKDQLFAVAAVKSGLSSWSLDLVKAPLSSPGKFITISKIEDKSIYYEPYDRGEIECGNAYSRSCISPTSIFTGTRSKGLLVFPLSGENPYKIGKENLLPSEYIQSCAWHEGKLYIALGEERKESFIVAYDSSSSSINTLASSQRNEKISPFDNIGHPFYTRFIAPDPRNGRIIFLIDFDAIYPLSSELSDMQGAWAFNLESKQWKQIAKIPHSHMLARLNGNSILIFSKGAFCANLNMETDETALLLTGEYAQHLKKSLNSKKSLDSRNLPLGAYALINNEIWSGSPFSKISLRTGEKEILPNPNGNKYFNAWNLMLMDNGRQLFAVNLNDLWLLELKKDDK
ncbi:MAG: hypothetical protein WAX69_16575, partial [Victivallales bacterium]